MRIMANTLGGSNASSSSPPESGLGADRTLESTATPLDLRGKLRPEVLPFLDYLAERIAERVLAEPAVRRLETKGKVG